MKITTTLEEKEINALQTLSCVGCEDIDCIKCPLQRRIGIGSTVCISDVATDLLKQNGIGIVEEEGE